MVRILRHRGPDGEGYLVDGWLAMGMCRLAIIDLDTGDQPIPNEGNTISVICNGEIYNYVELRQELEKAGHVFKSKSDTEILVHLYEEHGTEMLPKLNGMFAFAIWDQKNGNLFLARDRMGIKPLFYARIGTRLLFASEIKSLLTQPYLDRSLNMDAIADYLRLGYIPGEATPYRAVKRLLPGHYVIMNRDQFQIRQWWNLEDVAKESLLNRCNGHSEELIQYFDDAVKLRMRSDVPVAALLSGGLDSSLIASTAAKHSPIKLQTYNVRFADSPFDESPYAEAVALQSQTDHYQITATEKDAIDLLPLLLWYMDEPMADSAIIPSYVVSRLAAQNVKVCLSGLGGDELFGGYSRYVDAPLGPYRRFFARNPLFARALVPMLEYLQPAYAEKLKPLSSESMRWRAYLNTLQFFDTGTLKKMSFTASGKAEQMIEMLWRRYPGDDAIGQRQFIDQHTYLPDQILALTDRMSMAVSLEIRTPFLDYRLVRFASSISGALKQTNDDFKIYLKYALGNRVPVEVLKRRKWGFDTPLNMWTRSPRLLRLARSLPRKLSDLINPRYVEKLVENPHHVRYAGRIWSLIVLKVWLQVRARPEPPQLSIEDVLE